VLRVAIGDADPTYTVALAQLLDDNGIDVAGSAATAHDLVELVRETGPEMIDVVVVDARLPGGPAHVAAELRSAGQGCRVVVMSALDTPTSRTTAASAGPLPLVSKLDSEHLISAILSGT